MLSYRHGFHAGNHADVLKHAVLCFVLDYMQRKTKPLLLIDSHAGAGLYDLDDAMADKTGEAAAGIDRLERFLGNQAPPSLLAPYLQALARIRTAHGSRHYPGSALLLTEALRDQDRAVLNELHPTDHTRLLALLGARQRVDIRRQDGFRLLKSLLPPPERRALLVIDPPYEIKTDYQTVIASLGDAIQRLPQLVVVLWYPVVERARTEDMLAGVAKLDPQGSVRLELAVAPDGSRRGMTASGVLVLNAPYTLKAAGDEALPLLTAALSETAPP